MSKFLKLIAMALSWAIASAHAESSSKMKLPHPKKAKHQVEGQRYHLLEEKSLTDRLLEESGVSAQGSSYVSSGEEYYRPEAEKMNTSAALRVNEYFGGKEFGVKINVKDEFIASESANYFNGRELFATLKKSGVQYSFGRKLDTWAAWEETWQQGLFQPRYMQDKLRPESAGLTGLFVSAKGDYVGATLGLLPFYIPDFGAKFTTENHHFVSKNPWFKPPASEFQYFAGQGELRYSVDEPEIAEIVNNPGVVAKIEVQASPEYSLRLSYAYKPMSQILLAFPSSQAIIDNTTTYVPIVITPRVVYHHAADFDQRYDAGDWVLNGSVAYDQPDDIAPTPAEFTSSAVEKAWIFAGSAGYFIEDRRPGALLVEAGVLRVIGGDAPDTGEFAGPDTLFERRYQYYEAYTLAVKKGFRHWLYPLDSEARVIYDRAQNGGVFSLTSSLLLDPSWRVNLQMDFIGLLGDTAQIQDGFLSTYRANDRIGLGMSYVF